MLPTIHHDLEPQKTKGKGLMIFLLIIILMVAAAGAVYYWQQLEAKKLASATEEKVRNEMQNKITEDENKLTDLQKELDKQIELTKATELANNIFYIDSLKNGDTIANMTVQSLELSNDTNAELKNYDIQFAGQITLTGKISKLEIDDTQDEKICFEVDPADQHLLPAEKNSLKTRQFLCFLNQVEAKKMLAQKAWTKIIIDNYKLRLIGYDLETTADLIETLP